MKPSRTPIPILLMHDRFFDIIEEINTWVQKLDQLIYDFTYKYPKPSLKELLIFNRIITIMTMLDELKIHSRNEYNFYDQGKHCICRCNYILNEVEKLKLSIGSPA